MPTLPSVVVALTATLWTLPLWGQKAALFDELAELYPDADAGEGKDVLCPAGVDRFVTHTPRGVPAGVHVLVTGLGGQRSSLPIRAPVRCTLTLDGTPVPDARTYRLIDVPVEQNTGLVSRTEAWNGKDNPHVIRKAPFRIFEVLEPIKGAPQGDEAGGGAKMIFALPSSLPLLALRVEVPIAPDAKAERRNYKITFEADQWRRTLQWELNIYPVTVPPVSSQTFGYSNWFSPDVIAERHGLRPWSEPFWTMLARYADLMARGRQNTFWVRWRDFVSFSKQGKVAFDRQRFKRYVWLFLERGLTRVEGGHLARRHKGNWGSPRLDLNFTGNDVNSEQGRAELAALLSEVRTVLAELELPHNVEYLQHLSDEPTGTNAESYKALAEQVRRHLPGVKIFEATMSLALVGAVDDWCPQVHEYQKRRDFFETRKKVGDDVWVYTCLAPGGPWLNRLLDQQRLRQVYLGWALAKYELAGFLHWGLNHYRPGVDPFAQSVVPHGQGPPNFLPAGDSHVIYPGKAGPLSGQRFEAQRIGMEDAELLHMFQARDSAAARAVIVRVFRAFDDYETDIAAYRSAKRELLTALSRGSEP